MFFRVSIAASGLMLGAMLVASCAPDDADRDGVADARDRCPQAKGVAPEGCPVRPEIHRVNFFLETSASMSGYFKGGSFPAIVSDLTAKIDKTVKPVDIFFIADSTEAFSGTPEAFSSDIANTRISSQKSSELHKIIAEMGRRTGARDISLLASDCILSFTDAEIKKNPEINRDAAPSTLKTAIYSTFADLKREKNFGASVYAFRSVFNGTYYDYRNKKHRLNGVERPFYIWAIGNRDLLAQFNTQLVGLSSFRPEQELHFGLSDTPVTTFRIIPSVGRQGDDWQQNEAGDGIENLGNAAKRPSQFCIALDLHRLPPYAQNVTYLREHLKPEARGCDVAFTILDAKDADRSRLRSEPQKAALAASTHVVLVKVTNMATRQASVTARMPLRYATWYEDWSCMSDLDPAKDCAGKTFALQYLIGGVREAYETRNADYIRFTLNLEQ